MQAENVYEALRELLDCHPFGCPPAPEIMEILRLLFTEEEAQVALGLSFAPLPLDEVAGRAGVAPEWAHPRLESMANKGLAFAQERKGGMRYALQPPVSILEAPQWKGVPDPTTAQLAALANAYWPRMSQQLGSPNASFLRTIPVQEAVEQRGGVLPYEKIYELVDQAQRAAVLRCACRELKDRCETGAPLESCLVFDETATFLVERGFGRYLTLDEAKQKIRECDEAGLVHQVSDTQAKPFVVCACCPCCCGVLQARVEFGNPHIMTRSAFSPTRDPSRCVDCRTCADSRCPMGAIEISTELYRVHAERCIGCGLCATGCPGAAIRMERSVDVRTPPANTQEWGLRLLQDHGRLERFAALTTPRTKPQPTQ